MRWGYEVSLCGEIMKSVYVVTSCMEFLWGLWGEVMRWVYVVRLWSQFMWWPHVWSFWGELWDEVMRWVYVVRLWSQFMWGLYVVSVWGEFMMRVYLGSFEGKFMCFRGVFLGELLYWVYEVNVCGGFMYLSRTVWWTYSSSRLMK